MLDDAAIISFILGRIDKNDTFAQQNFLESTFLYLEEYDTAGSCSDVLPNEVKKIV